MKDARGSKPLGTPRKSVGQKGSGVFIPEPLTKVIPRLSVIVSMLRGSPDAPPSSEVRDWINNCAVQDQVSPLLKEAEAALGILIGK